METVDNEPETKYAAELSALDLGATITVSGVHDFQNVRSARHRDFVLKKVRRIEHYGPNFGSSHKKNTVWLYGVGQTVITTFDEQVKVKHG